MKIKIGLALIMAATLVGCAGTTPVYVTVTPAPTAPPTCASRIGTLLTKADETGWCTDPNNRGDTTLYQPAGFTACDNFEVYITFGHLEGLEGQKAVWDEGEQTLDRETCVTTPYVP